jgi:serine/threonine protein kinase/tetratricopeptide (TPR) repeat protein
MGVVYRAHDERLDREVAVKLLKPGLAGQLDRVRRFTTEARAMAAVAHPNIVAIHEVGSWDGRPYIVSELLQGETLRDRILSSGAIEVTTAVKYAIHITRGLEAAHNCGFVHRDVKSENVFLTSDGQIKLLDFGIAALIAGDPERGGASGEGSTREDTQPGDLAGTPCCMSPEQIRGLPVDGRADIFALGVALHEMLSGRRPFSGATPGETMAMVLHDDPPPLGRRIPRPVKEIVSRCLEKRPEDRFSSAHDLALALTAVGSDQSHERPTSIRSLKRVMPQGPNLSWQRRAWPAVVAAIVALTILGFRIMQGTSGGGSPDSDLVPRRVAVVPFDDIDTPGQLETLGMLAAVRLSRSLAALREVEVVRVEAGDAYPLASLLKAQRIGKATRAGLVLGGTVARRGDRVEFAATLEDGASGRIVSVLGAVSASLEYPDEALDVLGGRALIAVERHLHPSLAFASGDRWPRYEAYREYRSSLEDAGSAPLEEALRHVERALELDPGYAQVRLVWAGGMTLARPEVVGPDFPSSHLTRLLPLHRDRLSGSQSKILDGILMRIDGNWLGASQVFREILESDPRSCVSRTYVIDSAVRANRPRQAIDAFEELVWDPIIPPQAKEIAIAAAAKAYHLLGRHDDELEALERLGPGPAHKNTRLWAVQQKMIALAAAGRLDTLNRVIEDALVQPETVPYQRAQVMVATAVELREHGYRAAATRLAERALDDFRASMPRQNSHVGFGSCCFDAMYLSGHAEEAHALVLEGAPTWADPFERARLLGLAAARAGHEDAARKQMLVLAELDTPVRYGQGAYARARIAALLGDRDAALHLLRRAIANGFWDYPALRSCPDLETLRDDPDIRELVAPRG